MDVNRFQSKRVWTLLLSVAMLCMMLMPMAALAEEVAPEAQEGQEMERIFGILEDRMEEPTTFDEYIKLATMAFAREEYDQALAYIDESITLAQGYDVTLGSLYTQKGEIYLKQEKYDEAKEALDTAETYMPDGGQLLYLRGEVLIAQSKYTSAIKDLERYVELLPEDSKAWAMLAQAYGATNDASKASAAQKTADELAEDPQNAVLTAARQGLLDGNLENALAGLNLYLESGEDSDGSIHFLRGATRMHLGLVDDAVTDLEVALALGYEDQAVTYEYLSNCYFMLNNFEKVLETGEKCIALKSSQPAFDALYRRMGIAALNLNDLAKAETYFAQSMKANPDMAGGFFYNGLTKMGLGKYEEAVADLTASIEKEEMVQRSLYYRGLCQFQLSKIDATVSDLEAAMGMTDEPDITQAAEDLLWQLAVQFMAEQQAATSE